MEFTQEEALVNPVSARHLLAVLPIFAFLAFAAASPAGAGPRQVERLDRGLVAIHQGAGRVYLSWRLLGDDPADIAFNVYRVSGGSGGGGSGGGQPVRLNAQPITQTTDFLDAAADLSQPLTYTVRPVLGGVEQPPSDPFTLPANAPIRPYLAVPIAPPPPGSTPDGSYTYSANDASVGDLDGDGEYELVLKWDPSNARDNSQAGYTGNVYLDAYKLDGTRLWRIDLGRNIRAGAHYTQFMVYDLDGDGRAEVAMKTAPGTIDGTGAFVLLGDDDPNADYRNGSGYILAGPEYLTVFDGLTGAELATVPYVPPRGNVSAWGDNYGNRVDRFLAAVAYLDGQCPSLVMCRGYYTRSVLAAFDYRDGVLSQRWVFDTDAPGLGSYAGQGNHNLSVADADGDGRDEIIYGAMAVDDDGSPLHNTGFHHGDAMHVTDLDPTRPGLEVFTIHEPGYPNPGASLRDAASGEVIFTLAQSSGSDEGPGRGVAADIWAGNPGAEIWVAGGGIFGGVRDARGNVVGGSPSSVNFLVWWDADPVRELLDGNHVDKYNPFGSDARLLTASGASPNNGTKSNPALSGDILGDWREEIVFRNNASTELRIYVTTIPATSRLRTLMHDTQYRVAVAWQNVAYNQPPHPGFFLGDGMADPPTPDLYFPQPGPAPIVNAYQAEDASFGGGALAESNHAGHHGTGFINFPPSSGFVQFNNVDGGVGGTTTLRFRYALGAGNARTGRLTVNGQPRDITFTPTGAWTGWSLQAVDAELNPGAANVIRLDTTGQDLANIDELQVTLPTPPPPSSVDLVIDGGSAQRSRITSLTLGFDQPVTVDPAGVTLTRRGAGPVTFTLTPSPDGRAASLSFAGPGVVAGSLPDGVYDLGLAAASVTDAVGQALTAGDQAYTFHRLFGDTDGNRIVNNGDLFQLRITFGAAVGSAAYNPALDYDGNGIVNNGDLFQFGNRFGQSVSY